MTLNKEYRFSFLVKAYRSTIVIAAILYLTACSIGQTPFYSDDTFSIAEEDRPRAINVIDSVATSNGLNVFSRKSSLIDPDSKLARSFMIDIMYKKNQLPVVSLILFGDSSKIHMYSHLNAGLNESELKKLIKQFTDQFELNGWSKDKLSQSL